MTWDEPMIRYELEKLDEITGLEGSSLKIQFINGYSKDFLAQYHCICGNRFFLFNNKYFSNVDFPVNDALDVIRHEYAHYMNDMIYHNYEHDYTWKICCRLIGACPLEFYKEGSAKYFYELYQKEKTIWPEYEKYKVADLILHPQYGLGIISSIDGPVFSRRIDVDFESGISKRLGLSWVHNNCKRVA